MQPARDHIATRLSSGERWWIVVVALVFAIVAVLVGRMAAQTLSETPMDVLADEEPADFEQLATMRGLPWIPIQCVGRLCEPRPFGLPFVWDLTLGHERAVCLTPQGMALADNVAARPPDPCLFSTGKGGVLEIKLEYDARGEAPWLDLSVVNPGARRSLLQSQLQSQPTTATAWFAVAVPRASELVLGLRATPDGAPPSVRIVELRTRLVRTAALD